MKPKHQRAIQNIGVAVVSVALVLLLYVCYLLLAPANIIDIKQNPLPIVPPEVKSGEIASIQLDYCKMKDIPAKVTIDFIGPYVLPSLSTSRDFQMGCHVATLPVTIPLSAPTSNYKLHVELDYQANALQRKVYDFDSQLFHVTSSRSTTPDLPVTLNIKN